VRIEAFETEIEASGWLKIKRDLQCTDYATWWQLNGYIPRDLPTISNLITTTKCLKEANAMGTVTRTLLTARRVRSGAHSTV
jgi:hypothetical protein